MVGSVVECTIEEETEMSERTSAETGDYTENKNTELAAVVDAEPYEASHCVLCNERPVDTAYNP